MPNFYAHLLFGRQVSRLLPSELQRTVLRQWDSFCCGNFGPDPLYFYVGGRHAPAVRQAGIRLHHGSGRQAMEALRPAIAENRSCAAAFGAGYFLHYYLDSRLHPFVLKTVAAGQITHFALEGEFDRYLLQRDGRAYPDALPERPVSRELLLAAASIAPEVTPENYRVALRRFRMVSCRIGGWAGTPVRHVINAASYIPPARLLRGSVPGQKPQGEMLDALMEMDRQFRGQVPEAADLLIETIRALGNGGALPAGLDTDYSGNEVQ